MNAGLCLQILSPATGQAVVAGSEVTVRVQAALACGCPTGAGGRYDYRRFRVEASLVRNDGEPVAVSLAPGRDAGEFLGRIVVRGAGDHLLTIEAYDPESGLAGRARTELRAR